VNGLCYNPVVYLHHAVLSFQQETLFF